MSADSEIVETIKKILASERKVEFAYLFGSMSAGKTGRLSDIDLAVYLDNRLDIFNYRLVFLEKLSRELKTENIDLVVLNMAPILLKFEVIKHGFLLKENRTKRVAFEADVIQEYLDTAYLRQIQRPYIYEQIKREICFG